MSSASSRRQITTSTSHAFGRYFPHLCPDDAGTHYPCSCAGFLAPASLRRHLQLSLVSEQEKFSRDCETLCTTQVPSVCNERSFFLPENCMLHCFHTHVKRPDAMPSGRLPLSLPRSNRRTSSTWSPILPSACRFRTLARPTSCRTVGVSDACNPNPCLNGGSCALDPAGGHICTCSSDAYAGMHCQTETDGTFSGDETLELAGGVCLSEAGDTLESIRTNECVGRRFGGCLR